MTRYLEKIAMRSGGLPQAPDAPRPLTPEKPIVIAPAKDDPLEPQASGDEAPVYPIQHRVAASPKEQDRSIMRPLPPASVEYAGEQRSLQESPAIMPVEQQQPARIDQPFAAATMPHQQESIEHSSLSTMDNKEKVSVAVPLHVIEQKTERIETVIREVGDRGQRMRPEPVVDQSLQPLVQKTAERLESHSEDDKGLVIGRLTVEVVKPAPTPVKPGRVTPRRTAERTQKNSLPRDRGLGLWQH